MSKKVIIERSSKERIESITIGDEKFSLHDDFNYADGGTIIEILDREMIRKEYEEGLGWNESLVWKMIRMSCLRMLFAN